MKTPARLSPTHLGDARALLVRNVRVRNNGRSSRRAHRRPRGRKVWDGVALRDIRNRIMRVGFPARTRASICRWRPADPAHLQSIASLAPHHRCAVSRRPHRPAREQHAITTRRSVRLRGSPPSGCVSVDQLVSRRGEAAVPPCRLTRDRVIGAAVVQRVHLDLLVAKRQA